MKWFHPAVGAWFESRFAAPTPAQAEAWPAVKQGRHTLIAAPTGSGKTLAAFLAAIDDLVHIGLDHSLRDQVYVLYVSPLKALSNDIEKNLREPLQGITDELTRSQLHDVQIRAQVRTGDTTQGDREKMRRKPPHILVTTPESLHILLTSASGRAMLQTVRTVIVDEIHALAPNKRGAHLTLSLERLQHLVDHSAENPPGHRLTRIGLSATQKPIEIVARFLTGTRDEACTIIDSGYVHERDVAIEVPASPLSAVMSNEVWQELYNRLTELIHEHKTTLIFVNNRRLAERATRFLAERIGEDNIAAHHGSLAREHRLDAEQRLKHGELKAMVATASLELGIDIGDVDLVCQIGSPRAIATFLQRVGRSGHAVGAMPRGRLFPQSRDDLVECVAVLDAVQRGELDVLQVPPGAMDVLAQQVIAELSQREWHEDELFDCVTQAYPYRELTREHYDEVLTMLADGFTTRRGRRSAYVYRDVVNKQLRARKGARITAVTNAGAIPDQFDYEVIMEPEGRFIGSVNEDFAFESLAGDIFQLGNASYRILRVERGTVRVEDAHGQPPNIPFWFGEAPGRSDALSFAVSRLRENIEQKLPDGMDACIQWLVNSLRISGQAAVQLTEYLSAARNALGALPKQNLIVFERFFDEAGDQHIVIHSPYGSRLNRAWGLALRKRFCRKFNFELQAAALEDSIVISLGATHSFPLDEVQHYVKAATAREIVKQAVLAVPLFMTRWRWVASIALALQRNRNGKRVPAQFQRMDAEDLIAVVFPDQLACQDNITGEREIPDHPLVNQTLYDCLHEAMDIEGLENLLRAVESKTIKISCCDLAGASPLAQEILSARPYAFLDDAPAEERRTQAVATRRFIDPAEAGELGRLSPEAIALVQEQARPQVSNADDLYDALMRLGYLREDEVPQADQHCEWHDYFSQLVTQQRATVFVTAEHMRFWVCAERLALLQAVHPGAGLQPAIEAAGTVATQPIDRETALVEILRGRLECLGPVSEQSLAAHMQLTLSEVQIALRTLESQGFAMQGYFSADAKSNNSLEWCERGLLARIHHYTLKQLRKAVQPVSPAAFMNFLFAWQDVSNDDATKQTGEQALIRTLRQLEGFNIPAGAWESDVLPSRIELYTSSDLDRLCGGGRFIWTRLLSKNKSGGGPVKATPVAILEREQAKHWLSLAYHADSQALSSTAMKVLQCLQTQGASFFIDLVQHTGLLRTQVESALGELAAAGFISSDSFAGLRALVTPAQTKRRQERRLRQPFGGLDNAGRWALVSRVNVDHGESATGKLNRWLSTPYETLEYIARVLLRRYGVVFRKLLERENLMPPWRELLYAFRRLEARGEIRGGRFVDGFSGEQFALPDAASVLRKFAENKNDENTYVINAADPLNLTGIILPGERIAAQSGNRILFCAGNPLAIQTGRDVHFLGKLSNQQQWAARSQLAKHVNPAAFTGMPRYRQ